MHSIKRFSFLFSCFLLSILISACGSKGDLYQVVEPEAEQNSTVKEPQQTSKDTQKKPK